MGHLIIVLVMGETAPYIGCWFRVYTTFWRTWPQPYKVLLFSWLYYCLPWWLFRDNTPALHICSLWACCFSGSALNLEAVFFRMWFSSKHLGLCFSHALTVNLSNLFCIIHTTNCPIQLIFSISKFLQDVFSLHENLFYLIVLLWISSNFQNFEA